MMETVRMGIIGLGSMGKKYCEMIMEGLAPSMVLVAVTARGDGQLQWAKENLPELPLFRDGDALIEGAAAIGCNAVLIATPHEEHPRLTLLAFRHGLHVLCEKPAGVHIMQVREMCEAAKTGGLALGMMFNQRTNPMYIKMHEIVKSGELGEIMRINWIVTNWFRPDNYYLSGGWRSAYRGENGGVLMNQAPHQLDMWQWICGMPESVRAFCHVGKWHSVEVEDDVTAYLSYKNGATGVFITSTGDAPGANRFELTLEKGTLLCEDGTLRLFRLDKSVKEFCKTANSPFAKPEGAWETIDITEDNPGYAGVLRAFAAHLLRKEPLTATGEDGLAELTLSNAMHLSSRLGETVELPIDEERFQKLSSFSPLPPSRA